MESLSSHASLEERGEDVFLTFKAHPNSSKKEIIVSEYDVDVYVNEPPDKGKANKAIIKFLAKSLGLPSSSLSIVRGVKSRNKTVLIKGVKIDYIEEKLNIIRKK